MSKYGKYFADVSHLLKIDLYRFFKLFKVNDHALEHAIKKIVLGGSRTGGKTLREDIVEARDTLDRWLEMQDEDNLKGRVALSEVKDANQTLHT